jgi:hypothetical protein
VDLAQERLLHAQAAHISGVQAQVWLLAAHGEGLSPQTAKALRVAFAKVALNAKLTVANALLFIWDVQEQHAAVTFPNPLAIPLLYAEQVINSVS